MNSIMLALTGMLLIAILGSMCVAFCPSGVNHRRKLTLLEKYANEDLKAGDNCPECKAEKSIERFDSPGSTNKGRGSDTYSVLRCTRCENDIKIIS